MESDAAAGQATWGTKEVPKGFGPQTSALASAEVPRSKVLRPPPSGRDSWPWAGL